MSIGAVATGFFAGSFVGKMLDNSIANILCVQTLRHGTSFPNYVGIRLFGGNPDRGGCRSGSTYKNAPYEMDRVKHEMDRVKHHFYVFKDLEYNALTSKSALLPRILFYDTGVEKWLLPHMHAALSGSNGFTSIFPLSAHSNSLIVKIARVCISVIGAISSLIISPTLRFKFSKIDPDRFENDPAYGGAAYRTSQKIESWRLGIFGSLMTGLNGDLLSRICSNPGKCLLGVAQLVGTIALGVFATYILLQAAPALPLILSLGISGAAGFVLS